eukprot:5826678-Pyramimonas_sp.AAC.1
MLQRESDSDVRVYSIYTLLPHRIGPPALSIFPLASPGDRGSRSERSAFRQRANANRFLRLAKQETLLSGRTVELCPTKGLYSSPLSLLSGSPKRNAARRTHRLEYVLCISTKNISPRPRETLTGRVELFCGRAA